MTALVRNNVNTVVDIEKVLKQLNNTQPVACKLEGVQLSNVQGERDSYLAGVVILCVLLALVILLIILCYMWSICPLYRVRCVAACTGAGVEECVCGGGNAASS